MEENAVKRCPACGGALECKLQNFPIGADGGGGLLSLLADQYEVDLYACPQCGKVELYSTAFSAAEKAAREEENLVVCPVCQTKHNKLVGCPTCALDTARTPPSLFGSRKKKEPLPWEK